MNSIDPSSRLDVDCHLLRHRPVARIDTGTQTACGRRGQSAIAGYTSALSGQRKLKAPEGSNCVMKTAVRSSAGSTQKIVDAAPPHMYSPGDPMTCVAAGDWATATVRPKPMPSNPTSPYPPAMAYD